MWESMKIMCNNVNKSNNNNNNNNNLKVTNNQVCTVNNFPCVLLLLLYNTISLPDADNTIQWCCFTIQWCCLVCLYNAINFLILSHTFSFSTLTSGILSLSLSQLLIYFLIHIIFILSHTFSILACFYLFQLSIFLILILIPSTSLCWVNIVISYEQKHTNKCVVIALMWMCGQFFHHAGNSSQWKFYFFFSFLIFFLKKILFVLSKNFTCRENFTHAWKKVFTKFKNY